jgi:hypothetical protein
VRFWLCLFIGRWRTNSPPLKYPVSAEKITEALIEGEYYVLAPSNKSQVIKTIMTRLKLSDPPCGRDEGIRTEALPIP